MNDVQVIKANRNENRIRGRKVEILIIAVLVQIARISLTAISHRLCIIRT